MSSRILWLSWSSGCAEFDFVRINKMQLKNQWLDGNKTQLKPDDILLTTNGQSSNKNHPRAATIYYEPYIYIRNELDSYSQNPNNWGTRFIYNSEYSKYSNTVIVPIAGYWLCDREILNSPKTTLFGMVLGKKNKSLHSSDIGYLRSAWVTNLANKSFKFWGPSWDKGSPNYQGEAYFSNDKFVDSRKLLSECKFGLVLDNSILNGYLTEKIWNCFIAGTVPIYYGDRSIFNSIPSNCFIYGLDSSIDRLIERCEAMTENEYNYYRENILNFLLNDKKFSYEAVFSFIDNYFT